jgi:hypothetical protein
LAAKAAQNTPIPTGHREHITKQILPSYYNSIALPSHWKIELSPITMLNQMQKSEALHFDPI